MTSTSRILRSLISCACACAAAVATLAPAPALAGNKADARAHVARASKAHKEARYDDARVELEAAYALDPRPALLYALGQVDAKLGNCDEAIAYYNRFAATQTDRRVARVVEQAIAACQSAQPPAPDSATLEPAVDDPPDAPPNPPNDARNDARNDPPDDAPEPRTPSPAPHAEVVARDEPPPVARAPRPSPWYEDKIGDALVIGGIAAAALSLFELRSAQSELDAASDRDRTTTLDGFHERIDGAHGKRTISIVFAGASGALIGAGVVHYALRARATETHGVGVAPARGGGVITYGGRF